MKHYYKLDKINYSPKWSVVSRSSIEYSIYRDTLAKTISIKSEVGHVKPFLVQRCLVQLV